MVVLRNVFYLLFDLETNALTNADSRFLVGMINKPWEGGQDQMVGVEDLRIDREALRYTL